MTFLTITQAAVKLNTTTRTVRRWCESGQIQASKFGRAWMIDAAALDTFEMPKRGRPVKEHESKEE